MLNKLKQKIFDSKFFNDIKRNYYTKIFCDAQKDLEETNMYQTEERAKELAEQMLNDMLSNTDYTHLVTIDKNGLVFIGGNRADIGQLGNLKSEAEYIAASNLWKLLCETPKELAQRAIFVNGETLADLQKGKSILYTLSTQEKILNTFKNYKQK